MVGHSRDFLEEVVSEWELAKQGEVRRISRQRARPTGWVGGWEWEEEEEGRVVAAEMSMSWI